MSNERKISKAQIGMIQVLLSQQGLKEHKEELVFGFSFQRTTSLRELTLNEARQLIVQLKGGDDPQEAEQSQRMVKRIFGLARQMKYIYGDSYEDQCMNSAKLNCFCRTYGTVKKNLSAQTLEELRLTLLQFEAMVARYLKRELNKQ